MCEALKKFMKPELDEALEEGREEGIRALIRTCKSLNVALEIVEEKLCEQFQLSKEVAMAKVKQYW